MSPEDRELLSAFGIDPPGRSAVGACSSRASEITIGMRHSIDVLRSSGVGSSDEERAHYIIHQRTRSFDVVSRFDPRMFHSHVPDTIDEEFSTKLARLAADPCGEPPTASRPKNLINTLLSCLWQ